MVHSVFRNSQDIEMAEASNQRILRILFLVSAAAGMCAFTARAQVAQPSGAGAPPPSVERATSGDAPDDPGALATDLSPALTHAAIRKVTRKVADWQLERAQATFNQQWTYAALYDGLLAASKTTGDPRYHDAMVKMATNFDWKLVNARFPHADDMALGQSYMDMYLETREPARMADTKPSSTSWSSALTIHRNCFGGGAMRFSWHHPY
jgi:hypothetical protein